VTGRAAVRTRLSTIDRHCGRSEAIHLSAERKNGLLRLCAPRNDVLRSSFHDPIYAWRGKLLDAFDATARQSPGYDV
jgi:hypothetical protein